MATFNVVSVQVYKDVVEASTYEEASEIARRRVLEKEIKFSTLSVQVENDEYKELTFEQLRQGFIKSNVRDCRDKGQLFTKACEDLRPFL